MRPNLAKPRKRKFSLFRGRWIDLGASHSGQNKGSLIVVVELFKQSACAREALDVPKIAPATGGLAVRQQSLVPRHHRCPGRRIDAVRTVPFAIEPRDVDQAIVDFFEQSLISSLIHERAADIDEVPLDVAALDHGFDLGVVGRRAGDDGDAERLACRRHEGIALGGGEHTSPRDEHEFFARRAPPTATAERQAGDQATGRSAQKFAARAWAHRGASSVSAAMASTRPLPGAQPIETCVPAGRPRPAGRRHQISAPDDNRLLMAATSPKYTTSSTVPGNPGASPSSRRMNSGRTSNAARVPTATPVPATPKSAAPRSATASSAVSRTMARTVPSIRLESPKKPATNVLTGVSYRVSAVPTCSIRPSRMMAMRSDRTRASS